MDDNWEIGQTIDGLYEIIGSASGGMGAVYFVNHLKWKIPLAVKTPLFTLISSPSAYRRYIKEAETWIGIGMHPHIVSCFYVRELDGIPRIFIEYVSGGTLKDLIDKNQLTDVSYVLDLAIQFSMAMEYVHEFGIIHRDIKPANCMITGDGELKVTDFGIAKLGEDQPDIDDSPRSASSYDGLTMTGTGFGTPEYMAPEQFADAKNIGKEADIYSFGVMLYEMVCGIRPFVMPSGMNTNARDYFYRNAHLNENPRPPIEINKRITPSLNRIIMKCLVKDLQKRHNSFSDILIELSSCCNEIGKANNRGKPDKIKLKAGYLNNRAVSMLDLQKEEEAVRAWGQALKVDPQHLEATFNYGYYRWWRKEVPYHEALISQLSNIRSVYEYSPEFWRLYAWIHYEVGDINTVEEIQNSVNRVSDISFQDQITSFNVSRKGWLRVFVGHEDIVKKAIFSPDGLHVLSCSNDTIRLWSVTSGREVKRFEADGHFVWDISFSPDGKYFLSGGIDKTVRLWEVATGKECRRFAVKSSVHSVNFSPDGKSFLVSDSDFRLRDIVTGKECRRFTGHSYQVLSAAFSPDGNYVVSSSSYCSYFLLHELSGKLLKKFEGHSCDVTSVTFSPDARFILSCSHDMTIRLWDTATGNEIKRYGVDSDGIKFVASFSPDGKYILSGGSSGTLSFWETASGERIKRLGGHGDSVFSVGFSFDGIHCLSSGRDKLIKLCPWQSIKSAPEANVWPVLSRIVSSSELLLVSKEVDSLVARAREFVNSRSYESAYLLLRKAQALHGYNTDQRLLDGISYCALKGCAERSGVKSAWHVSTLKADTKHAIISITFSEDGKKIASCHSDYIIRIWDVMSCRLIKAFICEDASTQHFNSHKVVFSPCGNYLLSGGSTGILKIWDAQNYQLVRSFRGSQYGVGAIIFSRDGKYILSGGSDAIVRLFDVATGRELRCFNGHKAGIQSVIFSPDDRYVLSCSGCWVDNDNSIRLWEVATGKECMRFQNHEAPVNAITFTPDGSCVLSGGHDKTIRVWDLSNNIEQKCYHSNEDSVNSVSLTKDGKYILLGSSDKTIKLIDICHGNVIMSLNPNNSPIQKVMFTPDCRYIVFANYLNCEIFLWQLDWDWKF